MQQPLTNKPPDVPALDPVSQTDGGSLTNLINANTPSIPSSLSLFNHAKGFWLKYLSDNYQKNASHAVFFLVVVIAIGMSSVDLSVIEAGRIRAFMQRLVLFPTVETGESALALFSPPSEITDRRNGVFQRVTAPFTPPTLEAEVAIGSPDRLLPSGELNINNNYEIAYYSVEPGDTIFGIAAKFGLAPETIMWSNESLGNNPDLLRVGQELIILPEDGVYHQVGSGDTIEGIAGVFKANPADILNNPLNGVDRDNPIIQPGQWLIVPGGTKPFVPTTVVAYSGEVPEGAAFGSGAFDWPASGSISQGYWSAHPGVDIAAWNGAPVLAADTGHVIFAGWDNTGYGYMVVVDHGNGFQSVYAHLEAYYVDSGQDIAKGQEIGAMGTSGNATGPHLHFELRQGTIQRNPVGFLP